jgi:septal ring factor EnvC (AmiA/AmiB activator)
MFRGSALPFALYAFLFTLSAIAVISLFYYSDYANAKNLQEEYKKTQQELKTQKKKLETAKKTERNILKDLGKINAELAEIENKLNIQRTKISELRSNIHTLQGEINNYSKKFTWQRELLKKRLRALQKITYENDPFLIVLSGEDPSHVLKSIRYLKDISAYDQSLIRQYLSTVAVLSEKTKKLKGFEGELLKEKDSLKMLVESQKEKKNQKERFLGSVRKEKSHYENMVKSLQESSNKILRIIEEANRKERELRKKKGIETKPGTKDEDLPEHSAFAKLKGKLSWPVIGTIALPYGSQNDPIFKLPVFRSGVHIKTIPNSDVKSVHEGKVVFAESFKGLGQLVIVNHGGGYHTLYGNLARIFSQNGAIIKERQTIGEIGESQLLGITALYFEIRYKGKPLNPEHWLKKS